MPKQPDKIGKNCKSKSRHKQKEDSANIQNELPQQQDDEDLETDATYVSKTCSQ